MLKVADAKEMCRDTSPGSTERILRVYRDMRSKQSRMSLSALTASCRVTDKLYAELKRRKVEGF